MKKLMRMNELSEQERESRVEELVENNINLVRYIVFEKFQIPFYDSEIAIADGLFGLYKAAETYDPAKGIKFATYASRCIINEINMTKRRDKKHRNVGSLEETVYTGKDGSELQLIDTISDDSSKSYEILEAREEIERAVNILLNCFEGSTRLAFLYSLSGMNQIDIAEVLHLSQSYISRIIKKVQKNLRKYASYNKKLYDREVFRMSILNDRFYQFTFSSNEVANFNKLFAKLLIHEDPKRIPTFKLIHGNNRIQLLLEAEPESFAFIARVIQEIDDFKLSFRSNNEEDREDGEVQKVEAEEAAEETEKFDCDEDYEGHESQNDEETETQVEEVAVSESQESASGEEKKSFTLRGKDTITQKILSFIVSKESFHVSDIHREFPECKTQIVQYALNKAKKNNLITMVRRGEYTVNK